MLLSSRVVTVVRASWGVSTLFRARDGRLSAAARGRGLFGSTRQR